MGAAFVYSIQGAGHSFRRYAGGVEQIGFLAVAAAACGYDTAQGTQFTTYLAYHFRREFFALVGLRTERQKQEPLCRACSLDAPIDAEDAEGATRAELVPDAGAAAQMKNAEEKVWTEQLHAALDECMERIDPRAGVCAAQPVL